MDQYASLMVDNGPVQTTSAPGNLVQLINAKPGLFLGGVSDENTWARARYNSIIQYNKILTSYFLFKITTTPSVFSLSLLLICREGEDIEL